MGELVRQRAIVVKYLPANLYGFTADEEGLEVFFHIRAFSWGKFPTFPPPIIGEKVEVEFDPSARMNGQAPKAKRVYRLHEPVPSFGVIDDFNEQKGYGFIRTEDGRSHYLHRSEVTDGRLPRPGLEVTFFEGFRQGRPRACYVTLNLEGKKHG